MKKKKYIIITLVTILLISLISFFVYKSLHNEFKLTSEERTWINENINKVQNVYVVKDQNIFSNNGEGVFYTLLDDFSKEYGINLNIVTFEESSNTAGVSLNYTKKVSDKEEILYKDNYVLLSKNFKIINGLSDIKKSTIGILSTDEAFIKSYLKDDFTFMVYNTIDDLKKSLDTNDYIILPKVKYMDNILESNLEIVYHFTDINVYYTLKSNDDYLSSILNKYILTWEKLDQEIKKEEFQIFTNSLGINDSDIDKLLSIDYNYGFINNSPYEIIMNGNYGGIVAEILQEFSEFSQVHFDITKYKNDLKLNDAINKGKVDLYFSFNQDFKNKFVSTTSGINSSITILTRKDSDKLIDSIYGLNNEVVYVEENSNIYHYLKNIGNIKLVTYRNNKELFKLNKEDCIIAMDSYIYDNFVNQKLDNYSKKYEELFESVYSFKVSGEHKVLYTLLNKYISYLDEHTIINNGINSHNDTVYVGNILNKIAVFFIIIIIMILLVSFILFKKSKKIKLMRRIKKEDKIRFIDELTCLKNRTYLSDCLKTWSNNTIYPQAIIVIDLNKLKDINDKFGLVEGDKQIQAAANILIKTQLDNSDLMRSDGNEFVIYTIGYSQKQVINYIHKLNKEFKKLPYNFGAEFGYSIIDSNLKTAEDALSEAIEDMKHKKESGKSEK